MPHGVFKPNPVILTRHDREVVLGRIDGAVFSELRVDMRTNSSLSALSLGFAWFPAVRGLAKYRLGHVGLEHIFGHNST